MKVPVIVIKVKYKAPSSRGLGHRTFIPVIRGSNPLGATQKNSQVYPGFFCEYVSVGEKYARTKCRAGSAPRSGGCIIPLALQTKKSLCVRDFFV